MDEHVFPSRRTLEASDDPTAPSVFMREAFSPAKLA
jgi:hypothetical protein